MNTDPFMHVYFIGWGELKPGSLVKIGVSKYPQRRLKNLQTAVPFPLRVFNTYFTEHPHEAFEVENFLKKSFKDQQVLGEWFQVNDALMRVINGEKIY